MLFSLWKIGMLYQSVLNASDRFSIALSISMYGPLEDLFFLLARFLYGKDDLSSFNEKKQEARKALELDGWDSRVKDLTTAMLSEIERLETLMENEIVEPSEKETKKGPPKRSFQKGNYCPECGKKISPSWSACHGCLTVLDGYELFFTEKDLAEYCEALCELEFSYDKPGNEAYFDFFMLFKNLFDAIGFHVYNNGPITRIAEYYMFVYAVFQSMGKKIHGESLRERMELVLNKVWEPLQQQGAFDSIDTTRALKTVPQVEEREQREQRLKSQTWGLGTTANMRLRADYPQGDPLTRSMFDLIALLRKATYGPEGAESLKEPLAQFKEECNDVRKSHDAIKDMWTSSFVKNVEEALKKVAEVL